MKRIFCLLFLISSFGLAQTQDNSPLKVQVSFAGLKPWLNFGDGEARKTFNTAVHNQALFFNPKLDIKPGYIKTWRWIEAERKYVFTLDSSLQYHNGERITAQDFEFVLIKPFITTLPTTNERVPLSFIAGIDQLKPGMKFKSGMVSGIKVKSVDEIEVKISSGHTRFLYALGSLLPALAPIKEFSEDYYTFKGTPIGCGPYKVVYSDPKSSMVRLQKVKKDSKGPFEVELYSEKRAYENQVDLAVGGGISGMRKYLEAHPDEYRKVQGKIPDSIELLEFNYQNKAAQNEKFREAVSYAFDKVKEMPSYPNQAPADQIIPMLSYGYQQKASRYDPALAKKLFQALPEKIRNQEYVVSCHGSPDSGPIPYYIWVKESLEAIGMKVKVVKGPEMAALDGQDSPAMFVFGRFVDSNPLTSFAFFVPGASNETIQSYPEYDSAFKQAEQAFSTEKRAEYIHKLSKLLEEKNIVIPLHQNYPLHYIGKRVKSAGDEQNVWTINIQDVELK